jgi:predicted RND superfamily exporter protein
MSKNGTFDSAVQAYGWGVIRWRWPILLVVVLLVAVAASGGRFLWFDTDYRVFFSEDNPQLRSFDELQNVYGKNDNVLFVLAPTGGEVFTAPVLAAVEHLTEQAWQIPFSIRVDSVTNFQHTRAVGDDLFVADLVSNALTQPPEVLQEVRETALNEPLLVNRLVSPSGHVTGVNVTLHFAEKSLTEVPDVAAHARRLAAEIRTAYPDVEVYLTGLSMLNNAFAEASLRDMQTLVPLMYLAMFVIMFWLLRSLTSTLGTLLIVGFSAASAMGLTGWMGTGLTPPSAQAATMIMTLAVADSIHLLVTMLHEMRQGREKREAIVESLRINMQPVFLTSLTTAIGFLSMNFSDAPPFRHLGNITATGVGIAFVLSVLFLPAVMSVLPVRVKQRTSSGRFGVEWLAEAVVSRRRLLLYGSVPVLLGLALCIPLNELNDRFVNYFDERVPFRTHTDFVMENLGGMYQSEHSVGSDSANGISEPAYMTKIDEFADWYLAQPEVTHVNVISDTMKRVNRSMHGDDPEWYRLPDNRQLAAQYLLLYELSLPYGLDLNNQINLDKSATRLTATLGNVSTHEIRALAERAENWLRDNAPEEMFGVASSGAIMFSHITKRNIDNMLVGTTLALILISGVLMLALRSFKIGLISLLPNLAPAVLAFGVWGIVVGQVNVGLSIVVTMTLGIVVDDTVHFLSKYLRARREQGLNAEDAVRYAFASVGRALIVTSIILVIGFSILSLSSFDLNGSMGRMTAITIAFALIADLTVLPALLMTVDTKSRSQLITVEDTSNV